MLALAAAHTSEADFVRVVAELVSDISDLIHKRQVGGEGRGGEGAAKKKSGEERKRRGTERFE